MLPPCHSEVRLVHNNYVLPRSIEHVFISLLVKIDVTIGQLSK